MSAFSVGTTAPAASTDAIWLRPRRVAISRPASITAGILLTVSVLSLWGFAYGRVFGRLQEQRSQHQLHALLREQLAKQTSPIGGAIRVGAPVAFLRVPGAGLHDVVVVEGTSAGVLETGPGHRRDTPLPGQPGVSVLLGRSAAFGAPFAGIPRLRPGASVEVVTGQGTFRYRVERVRRDGDDLPQPLPPGASRLTFVTSEGTDDLIGGAWERHTVYVDALLAGASEAPPARVAVTRLPSVETAMHGDPRAVGAEVVWLAALVAAIVVSAWALARWGARQILLVGLPVIGACVWGATEVAARLLPNLI